VLPIDVLFNGSIRIGEAISRLRGSTPAPQSESA